MANEMEELPFERGIFIHSENLESKFMVESLQALLKSCPAVKITSVECDEGIGGFKVYCGDSEAKSVLEKKYLMVAGRRTSVYPLGTYLLIHGVDYKRGIEDRFTKLILDKFGPVLHSQTPNGDQADNSCLVLINIPELPSLHEFKKNGYPNMSIFIPYMCKTLKVTLWCRRCKKSDHSLQACVERSQNLPLEESEVETGCITPQKNREDERSSSPNSIDNVTKMYSEIRMDATRLFKPEPTNIFAKKVGSEEVMKYGQYSECDALEQTSRGNELREPESTAEEQSNNAADATSTTDADEEIQIINETSTHQNREASSVASTSNSDGIKKEEPLSVEDYPHHSPSAALQASYSTPGRRQSGPSTTGSSSTRQITDNLSERLQGCISGAYAVVGILDKERMYAFLAHAKKKSNPKVIAGNYTPDVEGLKMQLQKILDLYYSKPDTGTKEDIHFIKWLSGLVKRFDGSVPKKRKSGRSADAPPRKK